MKALLLSILLIASVKCFAQDKAYQDSLKEVALAKARKDARYTTVVGDVTKVKADMKLADEGKISKAVVLKEYNTKLGRGMGVKKTFEDAEARMNNAGDKFIEYVLLTTASAVSLEMAHQKMN